MKKYLVILRYALHQWPYLLALMGVNALGSLVAAFQPWPMKLLVDRALGHGTVHGGAKQLPPLLERITLHMPPTEIVTLVAVATIGLFLVNTQPRRLVIYDRLMDDPVGETAALARFLGVPHRAEEPEVNDAVASFLDSGLRHHRSVTSSLRPLDLSSDGSKTAIQLAETAYLALAGNKPFDEAEVDRLLRLGLETVDQSHSPIPVIHPRGTS